MALDEPLELIVMDIDVKLYNLATLPGHEPELRMLPSSRVVIDTIKKEEGSGTAFEAAAEMAQATMLN
ncbi:hypothetical protein HGM15179_018843 [Zosterops borbonicus]|uniref:Uncharacterized protein n=1 Tax=Zosterops borbonicus TaxID=364589 RepID=A0A8K1D987_9PASS|nr:hypothetical protein HGM15179_018843 [Zosterops borbonicus]